MPEMPVEQRCYDLTRVTRAVHNRIPPTGYYVTKVVVTDHRDVVASSSTVAALSRIRMTRSR